MRRKSEEEAPPAEAAGAASRSQAPAPKATGLVEYRDVEIAKRLIFLDNLDLAETVSDHTDVIGDIVDMAEGMAIDLMQMIQRYVEVTPSKASDDAIPVQTVEWGAKGLANAVKQTAGPSGKASLGVERVRCYVRKGFHTFSVVCYDVVVSTWNQHKLFDPMNTWNGDPKLWLGFRPAPDNKVPVVGVQDYERLTSTEGLYRSKYKSRRGPDKFYWAAHDRPGWRISEELNEDICGEFLDSWDSLSENLTKDLGGEVSRFRRIRDRHQQARANVLDTIMEPGMDAEQRRAAREARYAAAEQERPARAAAADPEPEPTIAPAQQADDVELDPL